MITASTTTLNQTDGRTEGQTTYAGITRPCKIACPYCENRVAAALMVLGVGTGRRRSYKLARTALPIDPTVRHDYNVTVL